MRIISNLEKSGVPVRSLVLFHDIDNGELFITKRLGNNEYEIVTDEILRALEENEYTLAQFLRVVPLETHLMRAITRTDDYGEYKLDAYTRVIREGNIIRVKYVGDQ